MGSCATKVSSGLSHGSNGSRPWLYLVVCWPLVLLFVIAVRQLWAAQRGHLSPWKGGGFGMFAATDHPGSRFVHCTGTTVAGETVIVRAAGLPAGSGVSADLLRRLRTSPATGDLRRLVDALLDAEYVEVDAGLRLVRAEFLEQNPGMAGKLPVPRRWPVTVLVPRDRRRVGHEHAHAYRLSSVQASVWRVRFEPGDRTLRVSAVLDPEHAERPRPGA